MKIGELSKRTGVRVDTLRFYTKENLLSCTQTHHYWNFDDDQIVLVEHIQLLRSLGFSIRDIRFVFQASDALLDGTRVNHENLATYKDFFEAKQTALRIQKQHIEIAEQRINKILGKLDQLATQETFSL
ncbi:MerR family transcriptional regulator [Erysipelothrix anatis]|uniref:MerR family transcriptional regulator n=1 Tax=Erysipelothrix anatis TaxID=2683713 RepID=UPI001357DEE6|nr:MerR family transcriptional regulator [Erysipelothrix anatis]